MTSLELLRLKIKQFDCPDGWYVLGGCHTSWYIGLIILGRVTRTKKIGRVGARKINYFDRACDIADQRNEDKGYKVNRHLPKIKK